MQRRALVSIQVDSADGRSRNLKLTDAGSKLLQEAVPLWSKVQHAVGHEVGSSNARLLRAQLARLA
jgi:DNA-binding MarR family transcriptional regulator